METRIMVERCDFKTTDIKVNSILDLVVNNFDYRAIKIHDYDLLIMYNKI